MNPTPKTLYFDGNTPALRFGERSGTGNRSGEESPLDSVYYRKVLGKTMSLASSHLPGRRLDCNRYSVGVIRYEAPNGSFPEHIDHCNVPNGWVVLLSLGCTARFSVCKGQRHNNASKRVVELQSGDIMVFDPSTEAAIFHGVLSILPSTCPQDLVRAFGETTMGQHRYGVQCRTSLERPE
jgi:alkylated DNA repair dioxygenase AlkB